MTERKSGKRSFFKNLEPAGFQLGLMVQQVIMLLFDRGINVEIFCDIKDAA